MAEFHVSVVVQRSLRSHRTGGQEWVSQGRLNYLQLIDLGGWQVAAVTEAGHLNAAVGLPGPGGGQDYTGGISGRPIPGT
jgi:hypothetical protein